MPAYQNTQRLLLKHETDWKMDLHTDWKELVWNNRNSLPAGKDVQKRTSEHISEPPFYYKALH